MPDGKGQQTGSFHQGGLEQVLPFAVIEIPQGPHAIEHWYPS